MREIGVTIWCFLALICPALSQDDYGLPTEMFAQGPVSVSQPLNSSMVPNALNVTLNAEEDGIQDNTQRKHQKIRTSEHEQYTHINKIYKQINNGYRGGAMVKIGQRYFKVEPKNLFNVSLIPTDFESDADLESQYEEIKLPELGPGKERTEEEMNRMYLVELGHGPEMIFVYYAYGDYIGVKLSGDGNVPAGEVNFVIDLFTMNGSITFASAGYQHPFQVEISMETRNLHRIDIFQLHAGKRVEEYEYNGNEYDYDYGANFPPFEYRRVDLIEEYLRGVGNVSDDMLVIEADIEERMPSLEEATIFGRHGNGYLGGAMVRIGERYFIVEAESLRNVALIPVDLDSWSQAYRMQWNPVDISSTGVEGLQAGLYVTEIAGPELIAVTISNGTENVVGIKLTGDSNVPAGELNFEVDRRSLNGSFNCANPNYVDPFRVEAYVEITGNSSFDVHNAEFVYANYTWGVDSIKGEYHRIDLAEQYAKVIESENNLEEIEGYDTDDMPDYGTYDENLDYMYEDEAACPACSLDTLSSRFSSSESGAKLGVQSEITRQREELSRLRLALQNKEEQIESLNSNIQNLDNVINEVLADTSSVNGLDEQISEMKEVKIRQVALIENLESGRVLADCQKKSSVSEQRLSRLVSLTENYRSIIGIEDEHHNSMQLVANDNMIFADLHKGLLERQAEQNEICQTTLNEQNENMEELENEEKKLINEKILIQSEFEEQRARIETNIEREKSLRNVIENQKNTIEANRKKIYILKKTVSDLSQHVPDCNITMGEDSDAELDFDYQISDIRSFNEESLTAYMNMTAALKEKLDAQNESFTLCQESMKINVEELRSLSQLQGGSIHKIIKEVNSLLPPDRQIIVPDVPLMSSLPQPPRDSQLQLHAITLACPSNYRKSHSWSTIPYVDGDFVLPAIWPTCEPKLTLRGGSRPSEGNVFFDGEPVCDDSWGYSEAKVVCRELGFPLGVARVTEHSYFGSVSSYFGMDDVNCSGDEASLQDCYYKSIDDCERSEGAGVVCQE